MLRTFIGTTMWEPDDGRHCSCTMTGMQFVRPHTGASRERNGKTWRMFLLRMDQRFGRSGFQWLHICVASVALVIDNSAVDHNTTSPSISKKQKQTNKTHSTEHEQGALKEWMDEGRSTRHTRVRAAAAAWERERANVRRKAAVEHSSRRHGPASYSRPCVMWSAIETLKRGSISPRFRNLCCCRRRASERGVRVRTDDARKTSVVDASSVLKGVAAPCRHQKS